jgi:peptide/nickel transport system substrate-binding protein
MMNHLGKRCTLCLLVILVAVFVCPIDPSSAQTPKRGGWLKVATDAEAVGLDPHLSMVMSTFTFTEHVYQCLLRYNHKMELEPCLATTWEQPDPLTYLFRLRKGVKFHNGREMTADDVKYSYDRILDPKTASPTASLIKPVKSIEVVDKYTVRIRLKENFPDFLNFAAFERNTAIIPKEEVLKHGSLQKVMVGTGPFKLKEYKHGVSATYVRNEDYWEKGVPYIDGFDLLVVKDEASRLAGIRRGTYDIGWIKSIDMAKLAMKEPHVTTAKSLASRQGRFWLNHERFPFNNVKLRQAVSAALDRQAIIDKVLSGEGVLSTIIPPSSAPYALSPEEIAKLPYYKQDYDLARKLLREAGYPNGFEFTIKTSPHSPDYVPASEIIVEQLSKVGIKAKIQQMDWGVFQKVRRTKDFEANYFAGSWRADAAGYFYEYFRGGIPANETGQNNPEINRLMDLCQTEPDVEKSKKYYRELQYKVAEDVSGIFTYAMESRIEFVKRKIQGYQFMGNTGRAYIRYAWIAE